MLRSQVSLPDPAGAPVTVHRPYGAQAPSAARGETRRGDPKGRQESLQRSQENSKSKAAWPFSVGAPGPRRQPLGGSWLRHQQSEAWDVVEDRGFSAAHAWAQIPGLEGPWFFDQNRGSSEEHACHIKRTPDGKVIKEESPNRRQMNKCELGPRELKRDAWTARC